MKHQLSLLLTALLLFCVLANARAVRVLSFTEQDLRLDNQELDLDPHERDDEEVQASPQYSMEIYMMSPQPDLSEAPDLDPEMSTTPVPLPSLSLSPVPSPSSSSIPLPSPTASPIAVPSSSRQYPCRENFTLYKRYKLPFIMYYICEWRDTQDAVITDRVCPEGYFESMRFCVSENRPCTDCQIRGCGANGTYRFISNRDYCIYCPSSDYVMVEMNGQRKCYATFKEDPKCPGDQSFNVAAGQCL